MKAQKVSRGPWRIDGLRWSWIDVKLGVRMLVKYPGLTLVGGLGLAIAIAVAAVTYAVIGTVIDPRLPVAEGDRVVAIRDLDTSATDRDGHPVDLETWRAAVPALGELGAYRTVDRNLISADRRAEPVRVAELTASGFRIARVPALLGRHLVDDDERVSAIPVVVLGFTVWQSRFAADPNVVGKTLQLGSVAHTIVGVMPEGFAFPINNRLWTPLHERAAEADRDGGSAIQMFGRLAAGATLAAAEHQVNAIAERLSVPGGDSNRRPRPEVVPYPRSFLDGAEDVWSLHLFRLAVTLLLVVIGTNVAVLVYARTATRVGEITVRTALGATRARVVTQFFAEALVLSTLAAVLGLAAAWIALGNVDEFLARTAGDQIPFWMRFGLSFGTVIYVAGLAVLAAVITGVVPALKATGRQVQAHLQRLGTGGSGMRLGAGWTFMIVAQVAVTVALLPLVVGGGVAWLRWTLAQPKYQTGDFLTASMALDRQEEPRVDDRTHARRFLEIQRDLIARIEREPGVSTVVRMSVIPGGEPVEVFDLDGSGVRGSSGVAAAVSCVAVDHFATFAVPVLAGRSFDARDSTPASPAAVVNEAFVKKILGPGNPLGRRIRSSDRGGSAGETARPWFEVVGVVPNFPAAIDTDYVKPRLYRPLLADDARAATLAIRLRSGNPAAFAQRVRDLAAAIDPMLRLTAVETLDAALGDQQMLLQSLLLGAALVAGGTLLLSIAGIYALVSLTVTRRRREIAVRLALGAEPRRLLGHILSRALGQIAIGIAIGTVAAIPLSTFDTTGIFVVAIMMTIVGATAAIAPARRGLRIQPTDALKAE